MSSLVFVGLETNNLHKLFSMVSLKMKGRQRLVTYLTFISLILIVDVMWFQVSTSLLEADSGNHLCTEMVFFTWG